MTERVVLPEELRREIVDHCIASLPDEGCGLLALDGERVMKVYPTGNDDGSPWSYTIPPQDHYDAVVDAESNGWEIQGAFHSHPSGPAQMSPTDLERALRPGWVYVVVGLGGSPAMSIWRDGIESTVSLPEAG
ncbi:MAG TPA: M67 family metallopeptidase [Acidimicrobiia bacterium]|nr:M67 family metallopeptidase [Acidimicrobiia bacterium]